MSLKFKSIEKAVEKNIFDVVKFQLMFHCFHNDIILNRTELDCLALLGCRGKMRLTEFCVLAEDMKLLGSAAAASNCLNRIEKSKLFLKEGVGKKVIYLNPDLGIETKGNILLTLKLVCVDESAGTLEGSRKEDSRVTQSV